MLWQPPLPDRYTKMTQADLAQAITARRAELGDKIVILGHHYQQDEVIQFADFTGDSFKLSQLAAQKVQSSGAKFVIFLGVHFMAESADVLTPDDVTVILPDLSAGCSMADMADYTDTLIAWNEIHRIIQGDAGASKTRVIPICYMNSTAAIKAFCGEHGGASCTSSNCNRVMEWALKGGDTPLAPGENVKILFLPDQHLGRNTAAALGFDIQKECVLWDPAASPIQTSSNPLHVTSSINSGGNHQSSISSESDIRRATFILWKGHCSVHKLFRPEHVDQSRKEMPGVTVMVHPECLHEVVQRADISGSTERIINEIHHAAPGSQWAIGTEVHLVNRLAKEAAKRGVTVRMLSGCQCLCTTMYRIDMPHLLWVLDNLAAGKIVNPIRVEEKVRKWALVSLERMLKLSNSGQSDPSVVATSPRA